MDITFLSCIEERVSKNHLAQIVWNNLRLVPKCLITGSLEYVEVLRPFDTRHLSTNLKNRYRKFQSEQQSRAWCNAALFGNWNYVDILGIPTCSFEELFIQLPSRLAD